VRLKGPAGRLRSRCARRPCTRTLHQEALHQEALHQEALHWRLQALDRPHRLLQHVEAALRQPEGLDADAPSTTVCTASGSRCSVSWMEPTMCSNSTVANRLMQNLASGGDIAVSRDGIELPKKLPPQW